MSAAGVILIVALLAESHRLAFRDTLTGLPGRRALEERLRSLGGRYAVAMVDVDHFKKFNDTHGHDIGDQVLKLVGARLAEVGGGGIAFRYGGEEFSRALPRREPGGRAAAPRGDPRLDRGLPHGGARARPAEGRRAGRQAPRRRES